jgi:hypothetical protein
MSSFGGAPHPVDVGWSILCDVGFELISDVLNSAAELSAGEKISRQVWF